LTASWLDDLPLDPAAHWPAMGVRLDDRPWPEPADEATLAHRRTLLAAHPDSVLTLPGSEPAISECAGLLDGVTSTEPAGSDREAAGAQLAAIAVAQSDDLCLLAPDPGLSLVAGAVLFPSHWRLAEKLGRPLAAVHGRVPGYPADEVDRFLHRLRPGHVVWRRNLRVHRDGELHAPWPASEERPVEDWWLRSERQTLRRLLSSHAVLFTIRTDTAPLAGLEPGLRRRLASRFMSLPAEWRDYAGVGDRLPDLVSFLRS
jgi:dimethylamine monooxygenase subunit A